LLGEFGWDIVTLQLRV